MYRTTPRRFWLLMFAKGTMKHPVYLAAALLSLTACTSQQSALTVQTRFGSVPLDKRVTLEELERRRIWESNHPGFNASRYMEGQISAEPGPAPKSPSAEQLAQLRAKLQPGDQIWSFRSRDEGFVIVRGQAVVYQCITDAWKVKGSPRTPGSGSIRNES
jgi:hypothetical protein